MSTKDLEALKLQYKDNESIVKMVTDELTARAEAIKVKAEAEAFTKSLMEMAKLPAPPETIHNVYMAWAEVEIDDTTKPEVVEVPKVNDKGEPVLVKGKQVMVKETRFPKTKEYQWVVETNKGFKVTKADGTASTSKRAITVKKIVGDKVSTIGNFASASKCAEYLKIDVGDDSATRVLAREGYILSPYTGTEYTK
jgi:hypothetical protein